MLMTIIWQEYTDDSMEDCIISIANALDIPQSCMKPWTCYIYS